MAKEKCDNRCETCPMNGQVYCAVMFAKATNQALPSLVERIGMMELTIQEMQKPAESPRVINPLSYTERDAEEI